MPSKVVVIGRYEFRYNADAVVGDFGFQRRSRSVHTRSRSNAVSKTAAGEFGTCLQRQ